MSATTSPTASTVRRPRLQGRVAFVTGGSRGIGAAICHSLAEQGADVAAGYSRDRETAEAFVDNLTHEGLKGSAHQGNIGSADDCRSQIDAYVANGLDTPIIAALPTGTDLLETARALAPTR